MRINNTVWLETLPGEGPPAPFCTLGDFVLCNVYIDAMVIFTAYVKFIPLNKGEIFFHQKFSAV